MSRWTVPKAAKAAHEAVLAPVGFVRRGPRSWRDDFLHREVYFYAARFRGPEERAVRVACGLSWRDLPPGAPEVRIGSELEQDYLLPLVEETELEASLLAALRGPVLDYLLKPQSPRAFVDELLAYQEREDQSGPLPASVGAARHYSAAAWGALILKDPERCRLAIEKTLQVFDSDPRWHVAVSLRQEMRELETLWQRRHGSPLA